MANISGTNVAAMIAPFTTEDSFPTHDAKYGKGGYRTVANLTELAAIPTPRLDSGCKAYVISEGIDYRYNGTSWVATEKTYTSSEWDGLSDTEQSSALDTYDDIYIV